MEYEVDHTKLKYVLYARKSTDDPERQARSIPDQIAECLQLAKRLNLTIVGEPLREEKSAKKPGKRPVFRQMLKDLKLGKYDGILCWNPDRLARNMKEGGEVIDMIDEDIIKDLKFVTHHFTKDANGLMMLGLAFVLSKQYSDKLSQDVTRGMVRKASEGKSHVPKHGYVIDEYSKYQPDGNNHELIKEAWQMKLRGEALDKIAQAINALGYHRLIKSTGRKVDMDKRILSQLFRDSFYYGLWNQAGESVDLRTKYDFVPAVSEEEFYQIQAQSGTRLMPINTHRYTFYPFKAFVKCSFCDGNMTVGPSTGGSGKRYLNFRCETTGCKRVKKSVRVKVVLDWLYEFLKDGLNFTEADYQIYLKEMTDVLTKQKTKLEAELHSKQGLLKATDSELRTTALQVIKQEEGSTVRKIGEERVKELERSKVQLEEEISKLKEAMPDLEQDVLTLEDFLNLSKNAGLSVKAGTPEVKDQIVRIIFLNLWIDEEKVTMYRLKEPFDTLLKDRLVLNGRDDWTRTSGLTHPMRARYQLRHIPDRLNV